MQVLITWPGNVRVVAAVFGSAYLPAFFLPAFAPYDLMAPLFLIALPTPTPKTKHPQANDEGQHVRERGAGRRGEGASTRAVTSFLALLLLL